MSLRSLFVQAFIVFALSGCRAKEEAPKTLAATPTPQTAVMPDDRTTASEPDLSVTNCIRQVPFLKKPKLSGLLSAWNAVRGHAKYRMVRSDDFDFPAWVREERYWPDVERPMSYDYGEMSGADGLIAFITDTTITTKSKFSVVVFIERPGDRYSLYWIFRDADLSRATLGRHSGNVYLQEFRDDGNAYGCDVAWDRNQKKWACNLD